MPDIVDPATRSRMMAGIRHKDTKPELIVRRELHRLGLRYRLHDKRLPGKPDMVFPKYRAVIFVHGCFWHGHHCASFRWPSTRSDFWHDKIETNIRRDATVIAALREAGWRVGLVWECATRPGSEIRPAELAEDCANWLRSNVTALVISGE